MWYLNWLCISFLSARHVHSIVFIHIVRITDSFYCVTRMHSTDYAVTRCLSVCLSVTRRYSVDTTQHTLKIFSYLVAPPTILVFLYQTVWKYPDGDL